MLLVFIAKTNYTLTCYEDITAEKCYCQTTSVFVHNGRKETMLHGEKPEDIKSVLRVEKSHILCFITIVLEKLLIDS